MFNSRVCSTLCALVVLMIGNLLQAASDLYVPQSKSVAEPLVINGISITLDQIAQFAPIGTVHPAERYLPCSIEHILETSRLVDADGLTIVAHPTQADMLRYRDNAYHLELLESDDVVDEAPSSPEGIAAPMYVIPQVPPSEEYVNLNFYLFFAYSGAQSARVLVPGLDFNAILPEFGEHQGDLELIAVKVTPDFSRVLAVRYEAHGNGTVYEPEDVDFVGTHPLVKVAFDSHATFNGNGRDPNDWVTSDEYAVLGFGVEFIDIFTRDGFSWQPFAWGDGGIAVPNGDLRILGLDGAGQPISDEVWVAFKGRIGGHQVNSYTAADGIGSSLNFLQQLYVDTIATIVQSSLGDSFKSGDGTSGLGGRSFAVTNQAAW